MYEDYIFAQEGKKILDAAFAVHRTLGPGFLEAVYQEALAIELAKRDIPFSQQKELTIYYGGKTLNKKYYADFVCYDAIILELKAMEMLIPQHQAQLLNYLKATQMHLGYLLNFGEAKLNVKRLIL
ncbi:MAG: GxxExxY protein [Alloprevotella sp.]|nr:GxxExxY protein [Alloprevotella sp.]